MTNLYLIVVWLQAEVKFLGKFRHPNLVRLLGYCWEEKQFLLVYEYMQKGSLENHLFRKGSGEPISWDIRIKIAIGAAHGLAFLHSTEKQVIYRDFKSSNSLLDVDFNAKLSDFGLAKLGPEDGYLHITTKVLGTYGYAAPEYMATGHLYVKSDVYGFGVVLLEIITCLRVMDLNRPNPQINLVDWARPQLADKKKVRKLVDPRLEGQYSSMGVYQTAALILVLNPTKKTDQPWTKYWRVWNKLNIFKRSPELQTKCKHGQRNANHHHQRSPRGTYYENGGARANDIVTRVHDK